MALNREVFDRPRWLVVAGTGGLERYAAAEAAALIQQHVPYVLQTHLGGCDRRRLKAHNLLLVGRPESSRLIAALLADGKVQLATKTPQSYAIKVLPSPLKANRQVLVLAGSDERGVLYAVRDWEHYCHDPYAASLAPRGLPLPHVARPAPLAAPFHQPVPDWDLAGSPKVPNRGIWTWGHVIYDYRAFLENMSRWKLNTLICWNDHAPVNARQIVRLAHALGVSVVWGYTWCWGEQVDPNDRRQLAKWRDRVVSTYERQYLPTGADGIYFQTFTETHEQKIGSRTIAELAAAWVNQIAAALLKRHRELHLYFGVHATSIRRNLRALRAVDPRINMTWEDAGCFPFSYDAENLEGLDETLAYTRQLAGLRGRTEDVGFVLKGMCNLNWATFEHQLGPYVCGRADRDFIRRRAAAVVRRWKVVELGWRRNLQAVCRTIRAAAAARPGRLTITALVEDALWEQSMWLPVCLLAEALWNPAAKPERIVAKVSATRDAHCLA